MEPLCFEYSHIEGKCVKSTRYGGPDVLEKVSSAKSGWIMSRVSKVCEEVNNKCRNLRESG